MGIAENEGWVKGEPAVHAAILNEKRPPFLLYGWRPFPGCGSPGRTRTCDQPVNSRLLYQLSYRGPRFQPEEPCILTKLACEGERFFNESSWESGGSKWPLSKAVASERPRVVLCFVRRGLERCENEAGGHFQHPVRRRSPRSRLHPTRRLFSLLLRRRNASPRSGTSCRYRAWYQQP